MSVEMEKYEQAINESLFIQQYCAAGVTILILSKN